MPKSSAAWLRALLIMLVSGILIAIVNNFLRAGSTCRSEVSGTEIFQGITYGCEQLTPSAEGSGFLQWVRIDLAAPGIELYVTPMDPSALVQNWQYRLQRVAQVVRKEELSVAINGGLFESESSWRPGMSGDLAKGLETMVSDHVVSHVWEHTYLLWFDDRLAAHLRGSKPPTAEELTKARWGIGAGSVWLRNGEVWSGSHRTVDSRTAVAIDPRLKLLFLAVANRISPHLILQKLANLGAKDGMLLDGGDSSSMAIGEGARGVAGGVFGGRQPVATHFGVRARPLVEATATLVESAPGIKSSSSVVSEASASLARDEAWPREH
jgi:hypothetical protein